MATNARLASQPKTLKTRLAGAHNVVGFVATIGSNRLPRERAIEAVFASFSLYQTGAIGPAAVPQDNKGGHSGPSPAAPACGFVFSTADLLPYHRNRRPENGTVKRQAPGGWKQRWNSSVATVPTSWVSPRSG